jgi:hypothetical protein
MDLEKGSRFMVPQPDTSTSWRRVGAFIDIQLVAAGDKGCSHGRTVYCATFFAPEVQVVKR